MAGEKPVSERWTEVVAICAAEAKHAAQVPGRVALWEAAEKRAATAAAAAQEVEKARAILAALESDFRVYEAKACAAWQAAQAANVEKAKGVL